MHIETKQGIQVNYLVQTGLAAFDNTSQLIRRPQPIFPTNLAKYVCIYWSGRDKVPKKDHIGAKIE